MASSIETDTTAGATISVPFYGGLTIPVTVDAALVVSVEAHYAELHRVVGTLLVMVDTYDSVSAPTDEAAESTERWVRVLDMAGERELLHLHVVSAANGWRAADPILTFADGDQGFTIHRLDAPDIMVAIDPLAGTAEVVE